METENPYKYITEPEWRTTQDYNCKGMGFEQFFPSDGEGVIRAQAICKGCPIAFECLEYALNEPEDYGVWGGTSERTRHRLRRERGLTKTVVRGLL